jgi:hypothetical protein
VLVGLFIAEASTADRCLRCSWWFWSAVAIGLILCLPFTHWFVSTYVHELPRIPTLAERHEKAHVRRNSKAAQQRAHADLLNELKEIRHNVDQQRAGADIYPTGRMHLSSMFLSGALKHMSRDPDLVLLSNALSMLREELDLYVDGRASAWRVTPLGSHKAPPLTDTDRERLGRLEALTSDAEERARLRLLK